MQKVLARSIIARIRAFVERDTILKPRLHRLSLVSSEIRHGKIEAFEYVQLNASVPCPLIAEFQLFPQGIE